MANIVSSFSGAPLAGTSSSDILVAVTGPGATGRTVNGGDGNDVILAGFPEVLTRGGPGGADFASAVEIGTNAAAWAIAANPDVGDPSVPHVSIAASGFGLVQVYKLTVGAGQTLTADVDYGNGLTGGGSFDATMAIYGPDFAELARSEGSALTDGGMGSSVSGPVPGTSLDPYLSITNTAATAREYFIEISNSNNGGVPGGAVYMLNVSLTGHSAITPAGTPDVLNGQAGSDVIYGMGGNDTISGGADDDTIDAGAGDDLILYAGGDGIDQIHGGAGTDIVQFNAVVPDGESVMFANAMGLSGVETIQIVGPGGARLTVSSDQFDAGLARIDATAHVEQKTTVIIEMGTGTTIDLAAMDFQGFISSRDAMNILGDGDNESLTGNWLNNYIDGGAGDDRIAGAGGADWLVPGAGNNEVLGGAGTDMVSFIDLAEGVIVDLGIGTARSGAFTNIISGIENVTGTTHADYIEGDSGDNRLRGLGDYDWFVGSDGADSYEGGEGRDMVSYVHATGGVTVHLGAGFGTAGQANGDRYDSIERATGSIYGDQFYGSDGEDEFRGLGGYDWFNGSGGGRDRYDGGSGLDMVSYAWSGEGVVASLLLGYGSGGDAARDLYTSIERLTGSSFDDVLTGDNGRNELRGLYGEDIIYGNGGVDRITGGGSDDYIDGGSGFDYAYFSGNRADYTVTTEGRFTYVDQIASGGDGTDTLVNIEVLVFADGDIFL